MLREKNLRCVVCSIHVYKYMQNVNNQDVSNFRDERKKFIPNI